VSVRIDRLSIDWVLSIFALAVSGIQGIPEIILLCRHQAAEEDAALAGQARAFDARAPGFGLDVMDREGSSPWSGSDKGQIGTVSFVSYPSHENPRQDALRRSSVAMATIPSAPEAYPSGYSLKLLAPIRADYPCVSNKKV
jgi:hypothetical protein